MYQGYFFRTIDQLSGFHIQELRKEEIQRQWTEIWAAVSQIILHLTQSPIFYPGNEFTEAVYKKFFMDESVHVIAALTDGVIGGIIEWNEEADPLFSSGCKQANVGEAYVYPEYRGAGLAYQLLKTAENHAYDSGARYMWVEYGTANPEARGFWNKYFSTYQYELIRVITQK